jgi:hypothetical protein
MYIHPKLTLKKTTLTPKDNAVLPLPESAIFWEIRMGIFRLLL